MSISRLGQAEARALADGTISKAEAGELKQLAQQSGDLNEVRQILERDAFAPEARKELERVLGGTAPAASRFAGTRIGSTDDGVEVRVKREVGNTAGYGDRLQAIAVARLAGTEPACVVQGADRRWHAVETTANFAAGGHDAEGPTLAVYGLPSLAAVPGLVKQLNDVDAKIAALTKALHGGSSDEKNALLSERGAIRQQLAPLLLGVEASEVQFNRNSTNRAAGKVNLNQEMEETGGALGLHGRELAASEDFDAGQKTAFELSTKTLHDPHVGGAVLFHEVSHLADHQLGQQWVKAYEKETGRTFVPSAAKPFTDWVNTQAPSRLSKADAELVNDLVHGASGSTEARAYLHAFTAAIEAGAPDAAQAQLVTYAKGLAATGSRAVPGLLNGSEVQKALTAELKQAFSKMNAGEKKQVLEAIAAAKAANPKAWVSQLKLS
jgi:hydroxypyruvate isomerase